MVAGIDPRIGHRHRNGTRLSFGVGSRKTSFAAPIVIYPNPFYNGINRVAIALGGFPAFQQHNAGPIAENGTLGISIKRPAMPIPTQHGSFLIQVATVDGRCDAGPTRQRNLALPAPDALNGLSNSQ